MFCQRIVARVVSTLSGVDISNTPLQLRLKLAEQRRKHAVAAGKQSRTGGAQLIAEFATVITRSASQEEASFVAERTDSKREPDSVCDGLPPISRVIEARYQV